MAKVAYGADVQSIRGKVGTNVFSSSRSGPTLRIRAHGTNPRTPAQTSVRANLTKASGTFKNMATTQVATWQAYAQTITKRNTVNGKAYHPTASNAFNGLATKFLQVNPTGAIPMTPPSSSFTGDSVTVTAAGGSGKVTFTASGANAANIKTELLLQTLKSQNRVPTAKGYRSKGFVAFSPSVLTQNVTVTPGFYVPAYRFVNILTGQEIGMTVLPVVQTT